MPCSTFVDGETETRGTHHAANLTGARSLRGALSGARSGHAAHSNVSTCTANVDVGIEPLCHSKKVMLLHFSKCSGTTVCALAQQAGCETWKGKYAGVNCGGHLSSNIHHHTHPNPKT